MTTVRRGTTGTVVHGGTTGRAPGGSTATATVASFGTLGRHDLVHGGGAEQLVSESSRLELLFRPWHSFSTLVPLFDVRPMEADDHAIFSYSPLELFFAPVRRWCT